MGQLRRRSDDRLIAGVAAGLSARLGVDVTFVRVGLVLFGLASGVGVFAYVLAWLLIPIEGETRPIAGRALTDGRGLAVVLALIPVLVVALLLTSAVGVKYLNSLVWAGFFSAAGLVLVWRNAGEKEQAWLRQTIGPLIGLRSAERSRRSLVARVVLGLAIVGGGVFVVMQGRGARHLLEPLGGSLLVAAGFVLIFGPWWLGLARQLVTERQARVLAEQRADMAARVHDSVLQTLAMIQRSAGDPQEVVKLARAQERDLRSWLFEGRVPGSFDRGEVTTLADGVELIERQVEADHGVAVEAVTVGNADLTDPLRALLEAGREATVNAARWSGAPVLSLFAEVEPAQVSLFVRDRGKGFDPDVVGPDHRGIAESIKGRMARHGGTAVIRTEPGAGTEVELTMPRERVHA